MNLFLLHLQKQSIGALRDRRPNQTSELVRVIKPSSTLPPTILRPIIFILFCQPLQQYWGTLRRKKRVLPFLLPSQSSCRVSPQGEETGEVGKVRCGTFSRTHTYHLIMPILITGRHPNPCFSGLPLARSQTPRPPPLEQDSPTIPSTHPSANWPFVLARRQRRRRREKKRRKKKRVRRHPRPIITEIGPLSTTAPYLTSPCSPLPFLTPQIHSFMQRTGPRPPSSRRRHSGRLLAPFYQPFLSVNPSLALALRPRPSHIPTRPTLNHFCWIVCGFFSLSLVPS